MKFQGSTAYIVLLIKKRLVSQIMFTVEGYSSNIRENISIKIYTSRKLEASD